MLLSLLPGFRDLRAPLAAGYLYFLAAWLALAGEVPARDEATGVWAEIYRALDSFSEVGQAAALTFGAFLVGGFVQDFATAILKVPKWLYLQRRRDDRSSIRTSAFWSVPISGSGAAALWQVTLNTQTLIRVEGREAEYESQILWETRSLASELDIARSRLLAQEPNLFQVVDRLQSEGEFRLAMVPALAAVAVVLGLSSSPAWFSALILLPALWWQGLRRLDLSGDRVADALRADQVKTPHLELLERGTTRRAELDRTRQQQEEPPDQEP